MMAWKDSNGPGINFPAAYNPVGKTGCFWMPGYHNIFFTALNAIKVVLIVIVINKACSIDSLDNHGLFCIPIIAAFLSIGLDFLVWYGYKRKWKGVSDNAPKILQPKSKVDAQV